MNFLQQQQRQTKLMVLRVRTAVSKPAQTKKFWDENIGVQVSYQPTEGTRQKEVSCSAKRFIGAKRWQLPIKRALSTNENEQPASRKRKNR